MWNSFKVLILLVGVHYIHGESLKISIYYESLCPYSKKFIVEQLYPTYKSIGNAIEVDLVPFGHEEVTNTSGTLEFTCQHGPDECYGNKIQACAIDLFSAEETIEFVYCAMNSDNAGSEENLETCAKSSDILWTSLQTCYTSGQADKLLEENGVRTESVEALKTHKLPIVIFNDQYNDTLEDEAVAGLKAVVCKLADSEPEGCNDDI